VTDLRSPSRRGRPRDPGADARILDAACALLMERGYERMTVDEVADRAGVGKATVYRRYPSKERMAHDALQRIFDLDVPTPETGSLRGDLVVLYRSTLEFARTPAGEQFLRLVSGEAARDEWTASLYRKMYERRQAATHAMLRRAVESGELRPDLDLAVFVDWLPALAMMRAICRVPMPPPEDAERIVDLLLAGATPR
jgi:AcrR family transcriptional regulator